MTDVEEFIGTFLEHGLSKEDIKRYNREYYLRTRKLVGRSAKKLPTPFHETKAEKRTATKKRVAAQKKDAVKTRANAERQARIEELKRNPEKRKKIENKLNAMQRKMMDVKMKVMSDDSRVARGSKSKWKTPKEKQAYIDRGNALGKRIEKTYSQLDALRPTSERGKPLHLKEVKRFHPDIKVTVDPKGLRYSTKIVRSR